MSSLQNEIMASYFLYDSGEDLELTRDAEGKVKLQSVPVPMEAEMALGADAYRDIYQISEAAGAPISEKEVAGTMAGIPPGAAIGAVTAIPDLAALVKGGYEAATAEEGQALDEFLKGFSSISGVIGSEKAFEIYDSLVDQLPVSEQVKTGMKQGAMVGEVTGAGGVGAKVIKGGVDVAKKFGLFKKSVEDLKLPNVGTAQFPTENIAGSKVVFVPADILDFGRTYEGLSEAPIAGRELRGGSGYGTLASSQKQGLGFASLSPEIAKRIANSGADYMLVSTMSPRAHRSNIDFANILHSQMRSYVDEGFITPENQKIMTQKLAQKFPGLDDVFSDEGLKWLEGQSFETRAAVADTIDSPGFRELGAPPVSRLIKETANPIEAGYDIGQGSVLIKLDKKAPVDIRQVEGGDPHPSYPIGIFGKPVAQIPFGAKVDDIFDEYLSGKIASGSTPASAYRALTMALPVAELTPERLAKIPKGDPGIIKSGRQAKLLQDVIQDNWRMTTDPVSQGKNFTGLGGAEIIKAVQENEMSASLSTYTKSEIAQKAKTGELVFYGLGGQEGAGGTGGKIYFGLNKNTDYADMYGATSPELTPNEISIVGVMNNETGTVGKGIGGASILKALQEGATVLDAYAVPSAKHPKGFLPSYYNKFGFEEVDRIPYDEKYLRDPAFGGSEEKYKRITRQWKSSGWDESLGYPDLVIMKWKGNENARSTATNIFISEGPEGLRKPPFEYIKTTGGDLEYGAGGSAIAEQRPSGSSVGSGDRGRVGDGGRGMGDSLQRGISELETLDPTAKRALGLEN